MAGELIRLSSNDIESINNLDIKSLEAFANKKTVEIITVVSELSDKIKKAQALSKEANDIKTGGIKNFVLLGSQTRKKGDLTARGLTQTNEAVAELARIQQETIRFVCISAKFALCMHKSMAAMMARGFQDRDGYLHTLDDNTRAFAQHILDCAEDFTRQQMAIEEADKKRDQRIEAVSNIVESQKQQLSEKDRLDSEQTAAIEKNKRLIAENTAADKKRDQRIEAVSNIVESQKRQLSEKDRLDSEQTAAIEENKRLIDENTAADEKRDQRIEVLENRVLHNASPSRALVIIALIASVLSLVCSVATLCLILLR